jgi:hypothetical protein
MSGVLDRFSKGSRLVEVRGYDRSVCECCVQRGRLGGVLVYNRCWRTRGGRPIRLGNRPRRIPTETSRRIKASFTRVIDPTLQRINFTTLLGRRHPPGPHRRAGPHTGLSLAEEPETRSNSYLARSFSVFLLLSAILAHFFYVDSRYRTWSDLARNDALAGSRKFFYYLSHYFIVFHFFAPGLNLTNSRLSLGSVEGRKDPEDFPRIRTA